MQCGAAFSLYRFQHGLRIKGITGEDGGGAVGEAGQVAHHHAEAMVERDWNAESVLFG